MAEDRRTSIPNLFRCPISLDLFSDPVTISSGHTYDRLNIEKWLATGHSTCPVTMQQLEDTSFVPNHTLRNLIGQWLLHGISDSFRSSHHADILESLIVLREIIQSSWTPLSMKLEALRRVIILAEESDMCKSRMTMLGFFPVLLHLALRSPLDSSVDLIELSLDGIISLSPSIYMNKALNFLKQGVAFSSLVILLQQGNSKIKKSICVLLETAAASPVTRELCVLLGQSRRVLQELITLLKGRSRMREAAAGALASICLEEQNRANAVREGAVRGLVSYLSAGIGRNGTTVLAGMEALMGLEAGRKAAVKSGAVREMVRCVFWLSSRKEESEGAVGALLAVCEGSKRARKEALAAGAVAQLLLLLQSQCSAAAKKRAIILLKLLKPLVGKKVRR